MQNPPTVGLKWSALAIVLSKHSPEIAAEYANTSVALDCADPELSQSDERSMCSSQ